MRNMFSVVFSPDVCLLMLLSSSQSPLLIMSLIFPHHVLFMCLQFVLGGIFVDSCCHDIDLICWILGEAPVSVYAVGHAFNEEIEKAGDCDQVMIVMTFPGGVTASIDMNRKAVYGYDQRLEVSGNVITSG